LNPLQTIEKEIILIEYPERLIIEPTTRCNFNCEMCVKQSSGCQIVEGDLTKKIFSKCEPLLSNLNTIIFTGIGEPLLNNNLEEYVSCAKEKMPQHSTRGFQTNGKLLTKDRIISLIRSGINKICISIDTIQPEKFDSIRSGGMLSDIDETFNAIRNSKHQLPESQLTVGIEFVLMKKNIDELPFVIDWASKNNVDFIIVSHLTAYEKEIEEQSVFLNNSYEVLDLFNIYRKKAAQKDLDISDYYKIRWKFSKSEKEYELYNLVADLKEKALKQNLYINLFHLLNEVPEQYNRIKTVFDDAKTKAKAYDYPNCHAWCETRCDYVLDEPFNHDCFINDVPCCDCYWNLGFLNCLT
jgi:putative metalloenzyme radical SAM/SPASM domain maturase